MSTADSPTVPLPSAEPRASCPVCAQRLEPTRRAWLLRCAGCGFLQSGLEPEVLDPRLKAQVDEAQRADGLAELRGMNFQAVLDRLAQLRPLQGSSLLDVGCAHGWFVQAAAARGMRATGVEPDAEVSAAARARGLDIHTGFFPDALPAGQHFDVVVFNDVFEHLPDVEGTVRACRQVLRPGGLLVLNLPLSTGVLYRIAEALDRTGFSGPFERMWQKGLPSPHLSYFSQEQLQRLLQRHGLLEVHRSTLPSLRRKGLWARLTHVGGVPRPISALLWAGLQAGVPLLELAPADIGLQVFRMPEGKRARGD